MKKFGLFLLKYLVAVVVFLVITVILDSGIGFVKAFETAFIYLLGLIVAELLVLAVKIGCKIYKKSRAKKAEKALKAAKAAEREADDAGRSRDEE